MTQPHMPGDYARDFATLAAYIADGQIKNVMSPANVQEATHIAATWEAYQFLYLMGVRGIPIRPHQGYEWGENTYIYTQSCVYEPFLCKAPEGQMGDVAKLFKTAQPLYSAPLPQIAAGQTIRVNALAAPGASAQK